MKSEQFLNSQENTNRHESLVILYALNTMNGIYVGILQIIGIFISVKQFLLSDCIYIPYVSIL
jgi:hypothetical protein